MTKRPKCPTCGRPYVLRRLIALIDKRGGGFVVDQKRTGKRAWFPDCKHKKPSLMKAAKSVRCRHRNSTTIVYNPIAEGKQLALGWCLDCGAVRRTINGAVFSVTRKPPPNGWETIQLAAKELMEGS